MPPVSTTPVANCHLYQWHRQQICHRYQWHRWQTMGTIIKLLITSNELKEKIYIYVNSTTQSCPDKIIKFFWLKIFSICHLCQRHRWCTLSCEYLREFSKNLQMALMVYSGAWGKLIPEKTRSRKSCDTVLLIVCDSARLLGTSWYHW